MRSARTFRRSHICKTPTRPVRRRRTRMHLLARWRTALLAALRATTTLVGVPHTASAEPPVCPNLWANQQAMADEPAPACRETWLVDPGRGNFLSRTDLI